MTERTPPSTLLDPIAAPLVAALRTLIAETLREVLDEYDLGGTANRPEYIDMDALCQTLSTSRPTVRKLIEEGLPHVVLGDHKRFRMADVHAWLTERSRRAE